MKLGNATFDGHRVRHRDRFFNLSVFLIVIVSLFVGVLMAFAQPAFAAEAEQSVLPGPGSTGEPYTPQKLPSSDPAPLPPVPVNQTTRNSDRYCDLSCPAWTSGGATICNPTRDCLAGVPAYGGPKALPGSVVPRSEPIQPDTYQSNLTVADEPMAFSIVRADVDVCRPNCPEWIAASGTIKADSPAKLRKVLDRAGKRRLPIVIDSRGGAVNAAIEMGRIIRRRGLDIAIGKTMYLGCTPGPKSCKPDFADGAFAGYAFPGGGICLSACPFFAAGGIKRLAGYEARVGIHQITTTVTNLMITYQTRYRIVNGRKKIIDRKVVSRRPTGTYETTELEKGYRKKLAAYFAEMGVNPSLVDRMLAVSASDIYIMPYNELSEFKFATEVGDSRAFTAGKICSQDPRPGNCVELKLAAPKA
jgi:hypothetical protein